MSTFALLGNKSGAAFTGVKSINIGSSLTQNYLSFGAINRAGIVSLTQKIKDIYVNVKNHKPNKNLQILGSSLFKDNIITDGLVQINNNLLVNNINSNLIATNGYIINMPLKYDSSFMFNNYTNNASSYNYDKTNMILTLSTDGIISSANVIEFDITNYINTSILDSFTLTFDLAIIKNGSLLNGGIGTWISLYNNISYNNNTISYDTALGGISILLNNSTGYIIIYENGIQVQTNITNDLSLLKSNNEIYNNVSVQVINYINSTFIRVLINNIQYTTYTCNLGLNYNNKYIVIGAITGAINNTLTNKIKNIKLYGKYTNTINETNNLQIMGKTFLNGLTNINGSIIQNGNVLIGNNSLFIDSSSNNIGIGTTLPINKIEVIGNIKSSTGILGPVLLLNYGFIDMIINNIFNLNQEPGNPGSSIFSSNFLASDFSGDNASWNYARLIFRGTTILGTIGNTVSLNIQTKNGSLWNNIGSSIIINTNDPTGVNGYNTYISNWFSFIDIYGTLGIKINNIYNN